MSSIHETERRRLMLAPEDITSIDLLQHVLALPEKPFHVAMVPHKPGFYMPGEVNPIFNEGQSYCYRAGYGRKSFKDLADAMAGKRDVLTMEGDLVITGALLTRIQRHLRPEPNVPANLIKVAVSCVVDYLNHLCPHTNVTYGEFRIENFVRPEYRALIENEEFTIAFDQLLDEVMAFVGRHSRNIYFYKLQGTSLIIEKMCDWRIYKYHQIMMEREDEEKIRIEEEGNF